MHKNMARNKVFESLEGETFRLSSFDPGSDEYKLSRPPDGEWDREDYFWEVTIIGDVLLDGEYVDNWFASGFVIDVRVDSIEVDERGAVMEVTEL